MKKNSEVNNEEINLIELMYTLWEGKWKIAVAVVISLIVVISYQLTQTNNFKAITEIKPLSSVEINRYLVLNNLIRSSTNNNNIDNINTNDNDNANADANIAGEIPKITSLRLLNLYLDILEERSVFEDAVRKFNLLDASQYNNDQEYNEAVTKFASSVKILSPSVSNNERKGNLETSYHTISFIYHDVEKWENVLMHVNKLANEIAKKTLEEEYGNTLAFIAENQKYQLEDILIRINNLLIDYERETSNHVSYLKEQSEIARKLGIAKNTIEVQTFGNQNALLSNVQTDSPFYLRGYEAIDKEIQLIELRENKNAFIEGLFELEKKKRAIEQDQNIERFELALQSSLLAKNNKFSAASIKVISTKFEYKDDKNLVLTIVISLIVGIFYALSSNAFQSFRVSKKN